MKSMTLRKILRGIRTEVNRDVIDAASDGLLELTDEQTKSSGAFNQAAYSYITRCGTCGELVCICE